MELAIIEVLFLNDDLVFFRFRSLRSADTVKAGSVPKLARAETFLRWAVSFRRVRSAPAAGSIQSEAQKETSGFGFQPIEPPPGNPARHRQAIGWRPGNPCAVP